MRVLIVASHNKGSYAPFIVEQVNALRNDGVVCEFFGVEGKGFWGYLKNIPRLSKAISSFHPDVIHAHYGLTGLLANLQRKVPVITTYHGSDINDRRVLGLSKFAMKLSAWNIFVCSSAVSIARPKNKWSVIPCGIDLPKQQSELPDMSHVFEKGAKHILFAGAFDNRVKNSQLSKDAVSRINERGIKAQLIELKGYNRDQVNSLMYSCDVFLLTSFTEGSPQVVKEAMACGCPIVSVDVGDVAERLDSGDGNLISGNYVAKGRNSEELATLLMDAVNFGQRTEGRKKIIGDGLVNDQVTKRIIEIYMRYA